MEVVAFASIVFPFPEGPDNKYIVAARCRDLKRALGLALPFDVRKSHASSSPCGRCRGAVCKRVLRDGAAYKIVGTLCNGGDWHERDA